MGYQSSSQNFDDVIEPEITTIVPRKPSLLGVVLGQSKDTLTEDIQADAKIARFRAQLTEFSLSRIGALSVMEQQLSSLTPEAAERYQAIVDTCTKQVIRQLERW